MNPSPGCDATRFGGQGGDFALSESLAIPRKNGELVFEAPWEARAFGIAVALNQDGRTAWRDFSACLAEEIAKAERAGEASTYYERWLRVVVKVAKERGLLTEEEVDAKAEVVAEEEDQGHLH